jgi:hypothetical protein
MKYPTLKITTLAVLLALGLSACNPADVAEEGIAQNGDNATTNEAKTAYVTSGVITGFGSVYINGVEFETDGTQFSVDDATGTESQLKIGMYITLEGDINADGASGSAAKIKFENDVEGMVLANNVSAGIGTLNVMGQDVTVDLDTKFESDIDGVVAIDGIQVNNLVDVSGYSSGNGSIYATRVELKKAAHEGEEVELKGVVSGLTDTTFAIGSMTIDYSSAQLEDFEDVVLADGMYVEVKSTSGLNDQQQLVASKIQLEEKDGKGEKRESGKEMEIEGVITAIVDSSNSFVEVNGQKVMLAEDTKFENGAIADLLAGKKIEVEGRFDDDGLFVAKEIKFRAEAKIKMEATLEAVDVDNSTVTVFGQTLKVNTMTVMDDEQDKDGVTPVKYFNLTHLNVGDWLELKAYKDENGNLIATKLKRDDFEAEDNGLIEVKLEGLIDEVKTSGELVVAGVNVNVDAVAADKTFAEGMKIEMKGRYADGLFSATEVSVEEEESED